jgi:hypothetical protein
MGLFGGANRVGDTFQLTWGAIPVNNGRLLIVDEFSGLAKEDFSKLTRVRSEGIAELTKGGIDAKTNANTRLIWISNPRGGRQVSSYSSGVKAVQSLIGANEDLARFDLVVVVKLDEVDINKINTEVVSIESPYTKEDLRKILLWTWSRKPEHVRFSKEALETILTKSISLSKRYSSAIPLIQGENVRFKIAKVACAIAARCFSTIDGEFLNVEKEHVIAAIKFIVRLYDGDAVGYKHFSDVEMMHSGIMDTKVLDTWFSQFDKATAEKITYALIEHNELTVTDFEDLTGHEKQRCRGHISIFVKQNAIRLLGKGTYIKRPAFIKYLKERVK